MDRKNFIKKTAAIPFISSAFIQGIDASGINENRTLKPPKINPGDTIGLVAPGGIITEEELKESKDNLEKLEFNVVYTENIMARHGYFAGTDKLRASDLNEMFNRKDVNGIVAARGGYGCSRILPLIDYEIIKKNPKVLLGYSDITALLFGIFLKTGLITFHGPVGISTFNDFSVENMKRVLIYPSDNLCLYNDINDETDPPYVVRSGKASGKLIGGNLSIVVSLIGTEYDVDYADKILFLEDTDEKPYRIDRMLTQLIEAGKFNNLAGIVLGKFNDCEDEDPHSFSLKEVLFDRLYNLNIPVIYGMSFGHITNKFTLPFGINAELNVNNKTITLLEKAVV